MYISKILLDVSIPLVRSELADLTKFKNTLSSIVNGGSFLYRLETIPLDQNGYMQPLVLVSEYRPEPAASGKPEGFYSDIETYEYNIPVRNGMNYKFLVKANPSAKVIFFNTEFEGAELQKKWLESESASNGFHLLDCTVKQDGYISSGEKNTRFLSVVFEGSMKITDENRFRKMLDYGIGRGKEYGLGLVSVESYGCKNRNIAEEMKAHAESLSRDN